MHMHCGTLGIVVNTVPADGIATDSCHDVNFVVACGTGAWCYDNFWWRQCGTSPDIVKTKPIIYTEPALVLSLE